MSLFALDVFLIEATFFQKLLGLLIHLIPSFILIIVLTISWKKPIIGGIIFMVLAALFSIFFEIYPIELSKFLIIPFPLILIGILFVVFGIYARKYNNAQNYLK
ncbi:MAG TPA: hypothetical protein P5239_06300 [Victivallales bacterium]|nr:hypothetical protein [Victivallales bacterium]